MSLLILIIIPLLLQTPRDLDFHHDWLACPRVTACERLLANLSSSLARGGATVGPLVVMVGIAIVLRVTQ